jgi:hypothetical protein
MHRLGQYLLCGWCALAAGPIAPAAEPLAELPEGWSIERSDEIPAAQREAIGRKLGGAIHRLTNTVLDADGQRLQVNRVECATVEDAVAVQAALARIKGNPRLAPRLERVVWEMVCDDVRLALRAQHLLGIRPHMARYRVTFDAAPLAGGDYMAWNALFNACLRREQASGVAVREADAQIAELAAKFSFAEQLALRRTGQGPHESSYRLEPAPRDDPQHDGDVVQFALAELPHRAGVPYVAVVAEVTSEGFAVTPAEVPPGAELLAATAHWPAADEPWQALAAGIIASSPREKLQSLLDWHLPGQNLEFKGEIVGSRYGAAEVLRQRYGHCWDFADCFVTLARAAGLPCRQVGGWLVGVSGHVWAEVWLEGEGWLQVDPTAGMECGSDYVPYVVSEDGEWPLAYVSSVRIEEVELGE